MVNGWLSVQPDQPILLDNTRMRMCWPARQPAGSSGTSTLVVAISDIARSWTSHKRVFQILMITSNPYNAEAITMYGITTGRWKQT